MQRQAILTVRLVIEDDETLDSAEEVVCEALEDAELVAHVEGKRIEIVSSKKEDA